MQRNACNYMGIKRLITLHLENTAIQIIHYTKYKWQNVAVVKSYPKI